MANKWITLGEFRKTKRAGMLVGKVFFKDLNVEMKAFAFLKTGEQKKSKNDPDLVLLIPSEEEGNAQDIPENLF